jgi:uncharacterized repeat protein (TIGR03803 family)
MKRSATLVLLVLCVLLGAAWAEKEAVLYSFCAQSGCADGENPSAGLVLDQKGNLYGTTVSGGLYNQNCYNGTCGVVFKLTPEGRETVLYSFCAQTNCTDGMNPSAGLVFDQKGNLYGTTHNGGAYGYGAVFKLTPEGRYTVLHSFCAQSDCTDGEFPSGGLTFDRNGNLYGMTYYGGAPHETCSAGCGVVFKLNPKGKETVVYSFCAQANCADGELPMAGLVFDQKGSLYGTTVYGGSGNRNDCVWGCGVVFKLTPEGKETVLYSFCSQTGCTDGGNPYAGLVFDRKGNLYGTTTAGCTAYGCGGDVFKLTPKGKETVLYTFCAQSNCADGSSPYAGLVFDQKGNLYGTTYWGGDPRNEGVVFKLTPKGKETVLYSFCWQDDCTDGAHPEAGLLFDQKGNLYGTTYVGGASGCNGDCGGAVVKLTP